MRSLPSHSGKARSNKGGTTSDMIRCWSICAEYRYSSEMSCIGQSEANHKNDDHGYVYRMACVFHYGICARVSPRLERHHQSAIPVPSTRSRRVLVGILL